MKVESSSSPDSGENKTSNGPSWSILTKLANRYDASQRERIDQLKRKNDVYGHAPKKRRSGDDAVAGAENWTCSFGNYGH